MSRFRPGGLLAVSLLALTLTLFTHATNAGPPWNIVLIYTDDQRWDSLCWETIGLPEICSQPRSAHPMPTIENVMNNKSIVFTNAFVSNPLCCPSRASILSGGFFSHDINVLNNDLPTGSVHMFEDSVTLPVMLQRQGYRTAFVGGKYMNHYQDLVDLESDEGYVPPGWSYFQTTYGLKSPDWMTFDVVTGSSDYNEPGIGHHTVITDVYATDYLAQKSVEFLDANCGVGSCNQPFFLMLATNAPHQPAVPAQQDAGLFADFTYRDRAWNEPDGSMADKPHYMQASGNNWSPGEDDEDYRNELRSLRAVDRAFQSIVSNLQAKRLFNKTVFIYVSDNGLTWGEHKSSLQKARPYEESIRVPLWIRMPRAAAIARSDESLIAINLDLAATILDLAGIDFPQTQGLSLLPLLQNPNVPWRGELLLESFDRMPRNAVPPSWVAIRTVEGFKYVEYVTGESELYDLSNDPYELESKHLDPNYADIKTELQARLLELGRGLAITTMNLPNPFLRRLPDASLGEPYQFQLESWGGNGDRIWGLYLDDDFCTTSLPEDLQLSSSGAIVGTAITPGTFEPCFRVEDTSASPQPGNDRPQFHTVKLQITVSDPDLPTVVLPDAMQGATYTYQLAPLIKGEMVTYVLEEAGGCQSTMTTEWHVSATGLVTGQPLVPGSETICVIATSTVRSQTEPSMWAFVLPITVHPALEEFDFEGD